MSPPESPKGSHKETGKQTPNGAAGSPKTASEHPELDVDKLHALPTEQQDLYLLTFSSDLSRLVATFDKTAATAQQVYVKKEVFKIIGLGSPAPTRVIRNNLGQCLSGIFTKGDRKLLFETVNDLQAIVASTGKAEKDAKTKHAAAHLMGAVFEAAGDSAVSASANASANLLKLLKLAQNHTGFRATVFRALGRIAKGVGRLSDEVVSRDVWKQCRSALGSDKALLVQSNACWCMQQLIEHTPYFDNTNDYEKLQSTIWKTMESASPVVRRSAAACLSASMVKNYSNTPETDVVMRAKKPKKAKKPTDEEDEDAPERVGSPVLQSPANALAFGLSDVLKQLSTQYCRASSTNRVRAGIAHTYLYLFRDLPFDVVEDNYGIIALHLLNDLLSSISVITNRYRLLITRKFVFTILNTLIGKKLLGEGGQLKAVRFLVNGILKDYPQSDIKERPEPTKHALTGALDALANLTNCLGSAMTTVADQCRGALLQVLEHPSYTVQVHASRCLQAFVLACPQQMLPTATICMNSVQREVGLLTGARKSPRKCLGLAFGLAAVIKASSSQPLYGSVEVYSRVFNQATGFLKSSSGSDLRVSATQIQVAWILLGGLMSLGPSFVKIHLSQLLLLWKNALPKPLGKNNAAQQGILELSFLSHVRECSLGALKAFLGFNGRLLTLDVSTRLASLLQNTAEFVNSLPGRKTTDDTDKQLFPSIRLSDYDLMVRRRLFECYADLLTQSPQKSHEALLQSSVLSLAVSSFADPETLSLHSLSSTIATASGNFESIWEVGDNSGFGITGLIQGLNTASPFRTGPASLKQHWLSGSSDEAFIDSVVTAPTCTAIEHDPLTLYTDADGAPAQPLATCVVDSAIRLFATSLPFQTSRIQQGSLEQISSQMSSVVASQAPAREIAVTVNAAAALLFSLSVVCSETSLPSGDMRSSRVEKSVQELLHGFINHQDHAIRSLAAECIGRLCKSSGSEFTGSEVKYLIDRIVGDRDPNARSGCAMALGSISSEVGGMAAGLHMKNIVGILSSLALDPHPTVHFWALEALSKIAEAAGLSFSPFVSSTLGVLAQLYVAETHGDENSSQASSNLEIALPSLAAIARCIHSLINVLGPDLQDMTKARNMILTLTYQFQTETSQIATTESLKCLEGLSLYASQQISPKPYLRQLQTRILSDDPDVGQTALTGLYNAMRKDAEQVLKASDTTFEEHLWLALDQNYGAGLSLDIVKDWIQQSGMSQIDTWILRIQKVLKTSKNKRKERSAETPLDTAPDPDTIDEEVAGFAAAAAHTSKDDPDVAAAATQELLRWQVRRVAMDALNGILADVAKDVAVHGRSDAAEALQLRLGEVIRIAFSASTASVVELRIGGIQIIGRLLEIFGKVPDPDFPEVTLLEQYQAQISSALTPAFAADSSPVLAAEAVNVCALFISTGIVTDKERMGRILRLLVSALEDFSKASETVAIGDLAGLSANAQVMVRLAVFAAWAKLQNSSQEQKYLEEILRPHLAQLTPLWLSSLQEYARLKFEPDISTAGAGAPVTGNLDDLYTSLSRETLLAFYQASWLDFVEAIASLIDENSELVFDALEGKSTKDAEDSKRIRNNDINYREEPVAFFFVLFGISFEALLAKSSADAATAQQRTLEILQALEKILRPSVAGNAIYQEAIFSETMDVFARLALTEGLEVQTVIVEIARNLCVAHPSARKSHENTSDDTLSDDIDQLFELTRIIVLVISKHVPKLSDNTAAANANLTEDEVQLILLSLTALVDAAAVFPSIIKSDLHACILHIFAALLGSSVCQASLVPQALPILRGFVAGVARSAQKREHHHEESIAQLRGALARFIMVIKQAQRRENEAAPMAERNALLAGTILLTSCAKAMPAHDPLLPRFVDELAECLGSAMTTKVAAGLSRSLLLLPSASAANKGNVATASEAQIASRILPHLLSFVSNPSTMESTDGSRAVTASALTAFVLASPPQSKATAFGVVVPALLVRAQKEGQGVWKETSGRLMELASREPDCFRGLVARLAPADRSLLEQIIRAGVGSSKRADEDQGTKEPSIALKLDF